MPIRKYKRAITDDEKRFVMNGLTEAWINAPKNMRLGQLLLNSHPGGDIFYVECYDLLDEVIAFVFNDKLSQYEVYDHADEAVVYRGRQFECEEYIEGARLKLSNNGKLELRKVVSQISQKGAEE